MPRTLTLCLTGALLATGACKKAPPPATPEPQAQQAAPQPRTFDALSRQEFNARAVQRTVPLFWRSDANGNGALDPDELVVTWGLPGPTRAELVEGSSFTPRFAALYDGLQAPVAEPAELSADERTRREKVALELSQGQPTLAEANFATLGDEDRAIVRHVSNAATIIERIYARQKGYFGLESKIPAGDTVSRAVFFRNQEPFCVAPKTENDPACNALSPAPPRLSGLYPAALQADSAFCKVLQKQPNAEALMGHFSVVEADPAKPGAYRAVPYNEAYAAEMGAVAKELDAAAAAITSEDEQAFKAYLKAAAQSFRTNDWEPANEAWAAMGVDNSKWYLRIAPDEVYYEPCAWKAGFHVSFARINPDSIAWQKKLDPVKGEMEQELARLAGAPYKARQVAFKLPDFIDIVLNAGDARNPHGATIGQSLPNWGPVAARGGRTVAMTNLYTDADSQAALKSQMASLYCPDTMGQATTAPGAALLSTVIHEAAHNLGPSHEYKVKGKVDDEIFGGPLASTLEELKAQSAALYFSDWLVKKGLLEPDEARHAHVRDVAWGFGHVSRGMYTADGTPKNYSQLASIQLGALREAGVLTWKPELQAANGKDTGCFEIDLEKWPAAVDGLAKRVFQIKARGDRKGAEALIAKHVDAKDEWAALREVITERWLRAPKASFVYAPPQ